MLTPGTSKLNRRYTYRPPRADHHMLTLARRLTYASSTPPQPVDHRPQLEDVRDQGQKGYCFAFATAVVKEHNCVIWGLQQLGWQRGQPVPASTKALGSYLSPDYIGWKTQTAEGTFGQDLGGNFADSFSCTQGWGVPPEAFLPYDADNKAHAGDARADAAAVPYRFGTPCTVALSPDAFVPVLSMGHCIAFGFSVYTSFEDTDSSGVVPPVKSGEAFLGGHGVAMVGWELSPVTRTRYFIVRNSWSSSWGDKGYAYMDDSYFTNFTDAWTTA